MITLHGKASAYFFDPRQAPLQTGKFSKVFRGFNERNEMVVIKQLLPSLTNDSAAIRQFRKESDLRVTHPNIISAIDFMAYNGEYYLIRPWVEGVSLDKKTGRHEPGRAVSICMKLLEALNELHAHGILHLDVQPKNVICGDDGHVYLTDLGMAARKDDIHKRQPFNIFYSAPEQVLNYYQLFNETSDLYAVGAILLELLTGKKSFNHHNPEILMNLVLAAPLRNDDRIREDLFNIILKATAKPRFNLPPAYYEDDELATALQESQKQRYQVAGEFLDDLSRVSAREFKTRKWWNFFRT